MDLRELKEKMASGALYCCSDEELLKEQARCLELQYDYNATRPSEGEKREALLKKMFAEVGENCYIEPPLHANWGGHHVRLGNNVYANFGLTLVDDAEITVGDSCMFGPNVILATAGHPIDPDLRRQVYQFNLPIRIGNNVWIGAGSVVTKDIPANVVAVGNPCRVLREIGDYDRQYYTKNRKIDLD